MSYIVALTGGIGSGKTTVANLFSHHGVPIVDADVIARQVVEPGMPALDAIKDHFGTAILNEDGSLNRSKLRNELFNHDDKKHWVNQLLHPLIQQETQRQLTSITAPYVLWVIPLLIENKLTHYADRILVIDVSPETQIERAMKRDNITYDLAQKMLLAQVDRETRLAHADDILNNDGTISHLDDEIIQLHKQYLQLAAEKQLPTNH